MCAVVGAALALSHCDESNRVFKLVIDCALMTYKVTYTRTYTHNEYTANTFVLTAIAGAFNIPAQSVFWRLSVSFASSNNVVHGEHADVSRHQSESQHNSAYCHIIGGVCPTAQWRAKRWQGISERERKSSEYEWALCKENPLINCSSMSIWTPVVCYRRQASRYGIHAAAALYGKKNARQASNR